MTFSVRFGSWFALSLVAAGCGAPAPEDVGRAEAPITQASTTTQVPWSVWLTGLPGSNGNNAACTASVLSEHWLLTAGHCVDGAATVPSLSVTFISPTGVRRSGYFGGATLRAHPDHDIGLVYLQGSAGLGTNIAQTGRAEVYCDDDEPWCDAGLNRAFSIVGWGMGSPVGGTTSCVSTTSGVKRLGTGFTVDSGQCGARSLSAEERSGTHTCGGDSGAPWLLRPGTRFLAFAVHEGRYWVPFDHYHRGTAIRPFLSWITTTSRGAGSLYGLNQVAGSEGSISTVTFTEVALPPPPPPPEYACPSGYYCCEPSGTACSLCVRVGLYCP